MFVENIENVERCRNCRQNEFLGYVWDQKDLKILDDIQIEALHIVTGAKKRTSHELLKKETNWPDLDTRRLFQQVTTLHKVIHKKSPKYLFNDLPAMHGNNVRIERQYTFNTMLYGHAYYKKSVIPSSIKGWNNLPNDIRTKNSYQSFRSNLKQVYTSSPSALLNYGTRFSQMAHTRMRVNFSNLNSHLFKYNLIASPNCTSCNTPETARHYFFICTSYTNQRTKMFESIRKLLLDNNLNVKITTRLLLEGNQDLSYNINTKIFDIVHKFISDTGRQP